MILFWGLIGALISALLTLIVGVYVIIKRDIIGNGADDDEGEIE